MIKPDSSPKNYRTMINRQLFLNRLGVFCFVVLIFLLLEKSSGHWKIEGPPLPITLSCLISSLIFMITIYLNEVTRNKAILQENFENYQFDQENNLVITLFFGQVKLSEDQLISLGYFFKSQGTCFIKLPYLNVTQPIAEQDLLDRSIHLKRAQSFSNPSKKQGIYSYKTFSKQQKVLYTIFISVAVISTVLSYVFLYKPQQGLTFLDYFTLEGNSFLIFIVNMAFIAFLILSEKLTFNEGDASIVMYLPYPEKKVAGYYFYDLKEVSLELNAEFIKFTDYEKEKLLVTTIGQINYVYRYETDEKKC